MRRTFLITLLMQTAPVLDGDTPLSVWALIGLAVTTLIGLAAAGASRYINGRIDIGIERERARLAAEAKTVETESAIRLTTVQTDNEERKSDIATFGLLAESLNNVADSNKAVIREMSTAYQQLAQHQQTAAEERRELRVNQSKTNEELEKQSGELKRLADEMKAFSDTGAEILKQIGDIRTRIGGGHDEPPLTLLIGEAAKSARNAADLLARAAQVGGGNPAPEMQNANDAMQAAADAIGLAGTADQQQQDLPQNGGK